MKIPPLLPESITSIVAVCAAGILASKLNINIFAQISFTILIVALCLLMIRTHLRMQALHEQLIIKERMMRFAFDDFARKMEKRQDESLRQLSDTLEERSKRMYR
ncbi:MAG: hypothetical protein LBV40_07510 [Methanomicrobiales archaeon]|jgi:signal transduction histidine kinase|nr:hypothetical protein [Methanomicrobiales archaeon]